MPADERVNAMTKVLGLTGGIASGKSTVSRYLKSLNIPIVDADLIAREVMRAGTPTVSKIAETFGEEYLLADGEVDRKRLGTTIFNDPAKRQLLNDIVQDEIRHEILTTKEALMAEAHPLIVLDIPLLFEEQYETIVDEVLVVFVDKKTQIERLLNRNTELSKAEALQRIEAQLPLEETAKHADILIDNNGTVEETLTQVNTWLKTNFGDEFIKE